MGNSVPHPDDRIPRNLGVSQGEIGVRLEEFGRRLSDDHKAHSDRVLDKRIGEERFSADPLDK